MSASRPPRPRPTARRATRVDVRGWLGGIRFSGFTLIMLGLVVLGVFVLVPTIGTYVGQQQQIASMQQAVQVTADEVAGLEAQRDRYEDPAYITTQARERLFYMRPGEVTFLVVDDLPDSATPQEQAPVSDDVTRTRTDWMAQLVASVAQAGIAVPATVSIGVPDPAATPAP